jgi:hypothetical protein
MIIDTYVYFVSYKYENKGQGGYGWVENTSNTKLVNKKTIIECTKSIERDMKFENVMILNFILLDSYNKEEREAKDEKD